MSAPRGEYDSRQLLATTLICWRCGRRVLSTDLEATWCRPCVERTR
jgi:hypothetical protein